VTALARRDRLGARRLFFDPASGMYAEELGALLVKLPAARQDLDPIGVDAAWGRVHAPTHTCLRAVRALPPSVEPSAAPPAPDLETALIAASARSLRSALRPVVALGGGLDAPLAVLAARRAGFTIEHAIHVSVPGTSYDEAEAARATAAALGLAVHELCVSVDELARALPRAVRFAETPLYNLHPVSRALVARIARERGHDALVTGDGADQAARGATEPADYVPVVAAITRASGVGLASPFLDDALVDLLIDARDPEKKALRELSVAWGLPGYLARRPKVASSAPPLPRAFFPPPGELSRLASALGRPLAWSDDDASNVGVASLAAFVSAFAIGAA
jgi:asparagine synthase (glutamine-hydrolysing)